MIHHLSLDYYQPKPYFEINDAFIPAATWPKTLIDLALERNQQEHKILRRTGIFYDDIDARNLLLTPQQIFRLIENLIKQPQDYEFAFLAARELFSADQNELSQATHLQHLLDLVIARTSATPPLLTMQMHYEADRLVIYWHDGFGASDVMPFLLALHCTALDNLSRWRAGRALPWTFYFAHPQPRCREQYQVHLGERVVFNARSHAMTIARSELHHAWHAPHSIAANTSAPLNEAGGRAFLHELYHYLKINIHHQPGLEQCAQDFGMSSASLKRKLQKHRSSFQQQFDLVRKHLALHWLSESGVTQEQIAQHLHFYDAANLRRAFKRWTGHLPGKL